MIRFEWDVPQSIERRIDRLCGVCAGSETVQMMVLQRIIQTGLDVLEKKHGTRCEAQPCEPKPRRSRATGGPKLPFGKHSLYGALLALSKQKSMTWSEFSKSTGCKGRGGLESGSKQGMIKRTPVMGGNGRRAWIYSITPKGLKRLKELTKLKEKHDLAMSMVDGVSE